MKKALLICALLINAEAFGMNLDELEDLRADSFIHTVEKVTYALSLDWCEDCLGFATNLAVKEMRENAFGEKLTALGADFCGEHTASVVKAGGATSMMCCCVSVCAYSPCIGFCECAGAALVGRKLYVMQKYGLSKEKSKQE